MKEDAEDFLHLYRDCLHYYGIDPATSEQETRVLGILNSGRHISCLMAYDGPSPAGFATWTLTLPAASGVALYMKEIFVRGATRGKGTGRALLAGLLDIAENEGCARFDWQTDASNAGSQAFYASLDAPTHDKKSYRIMQKDYAAFRAGLGYCNGC